MANQLILVKSGRNISIVATDDSGRTRYFFEDSSNVELIYNLYNNRVTLNIKGNFSFTTDDITLVNTLRIDSGSGSIDITDNSLFASNYALLFLNGGSVPSTPQNLQQVLNVNNTANDIDGNNTIDLIESVNDSNSLNLAPTSAIITSSFSTNSLDTNKLSLLNNANASEVRVDIDNLLVSVHNKPNDDKLSILPNLIRSEDTRSGHILDINFPKNANRQINVPDNDGTIALTSDIPVKKFNVIMWHFSVLSNFFFLVNDVYYNDFNPITFTIQQIGTGVYNLVPSYNYMQNKNNFLSATPTYISGVNFYKMGMDGDGSMNIQTFDNFNPINFPSIMEFFVKIEVVI